jgi:two-component system, OmpR family, catabolic regulation response regulator CreB
MAGLRAAGSVPVTRLTALGEETDRVVGPEIGPTTMCPKPFNPRELLGRIRGAGRGGGLRAGVRTAR